MSKQPGIQSKQARSLVAAGAFVIALMVAGIALSNSALADNDRRNGARNDSARNDAGHRGQVYDSRYQHNRYYPARGRAVPVLPRDSVAVRYRGTPYYMHGGSWYRPYGARFVVIAPPIGLSVGFLPSYYSTIWFGSVPYYYADDVYYRWYPDRRSYVVVEPPPDSALTTQSPSSPVSDDLFVYPMKGQSEEQQAQDRYECHSWAVQQTHYDPTQAVSSVADAQSDAARSDYFRAMSACLDARGYSVK